MGKTIVDGAVDDFDKALKPYVCHKTVHAAEITSVGEQSAESEKRSVTLVNRFTILLPEAMFVRYTPVPGDFFVVYEDGYESFSPRKAFLDGYKAEGESFADIKRGLKIGRPPRSDLASTNVGDGVALTCAPHPSDEERN